MKKLIPVLLTLILSASAFAHTNEEAENDLIALIDEIGKYSSYSEEYSEENEINLANANKAFKNRLLELTSQHGSLLKYDFPKLTEKMEIEASPDGHLKVYSWDTLTGGTMHMYDTVYQFRGLEGVSSVASFYDEGDAGGFVTDIFAVETKMGIVYLVSTTSILSSSYNGQSIAAFRITGDRLSDGVKIFKTASGATDSIGFSYDFFSVANRAERPIRLFEYDSKSKTLSFPIVVEDDKTPQGRVTSSKIVYRYDGEYFVRVKN